MGSRHGMAKVGRQGMAKQGRCRQTQPADELAGTGLEAKTQPADDPTGTGLVVTAGRRSGRHRPRSKPPADDPAGTGLEVKQPADEVGRPLAVFNGGWWRECGGAGHSEGGLGPT